MAKKINICREIRIAAGKTMEDIAKDINRSIWSIRKYEIGINKPPMQVKLFYLLLGYKTYKEKYEQLKLKRTKKNDKK